VISGMAKIQGQSTSNATHVAQVAATAALTESQKCVTQMRDAFDERRREIIARLRSIPHVECVEPQGAFYAFPDFSAYLGTRAGSTIITDDVALATYLIESAHVAIVPGSAFGAPGFGRLSYACAIDDIRRGVDRIGDAFSQLDR